MASFGAFFGYGAISAVVGAIFYANLPTRLTIGSIIPTVDYLAAAQLKLLEPGKEAESVLAGKQISVGYLKLRSKISARKNAIKPKKKMEI